MVWIKLFTSLLLASTVHAVETTKSAVIPVHPLESWYSSVEQAEAVERELLKLIYNDTSLPAKSLMGQLKLVLAKELKKKHGQVVYSCQRFSWQSARPGSYSIYQSCLPKERPEIIYVEISASGNLELNFYLQNLVDVVGFGSSILKRSTRCVLSKKDGELQQMTCQDLGNSRTPVEVMMLDEVVYRKDGVAMLTANGKFYKELLPSRSIGVYVPREGKVTVQIKSLYKKKPVVKLQPPPMEAPKPLPLKAVEGRERLPGELGNTPERPSQNMEGALAPVPESTAPQLIPPGEPLPGMDPDHPLPPPQPAPEATINNRGRFEIKPVAPTEGAEHNSTPQQ